MARIDHLFIVAGPRASGKSTFIDAWRSRQLPVALARHLPVFGDDWRACLGMDLREPEFVERLRRHSGVVVHYDTARHLAGAPAKYPALQMVAEARELMLLIVNAPGRVLARRLITRYLRRAAGRREQVPVPPLALQAAMFNRIATVGDRHWAVRRSALMARRWHAMKQELPDLTWRSLDTYLNRPDELETICRQVITAVSARSPRPFQLLRIQSAGSPLGRIRWKVNAITEVNGRAGARADEPVSQGLGSIAGALPSAAVPALEESSEV